MTNRFDSSRLNLLGGAAVLALALGAASPARAQDVPDPEETSEAATPAEGSEADVAGTEEDIVVTGFRASLENAVNEKKQQDQILESVSAEDIGKLPDASIAESIARLPGLTSQRLSGRANVISIRGFGPDFSMTLLNGREQTSTGDNRAVEFDQYPSEVVRQVNVYKSPSASLVGQGLVGTVDIRTIRPLDFGGRQVLAVGARASYADLGKLNSGSRDLGYRVNGTFVDQNADDTFGVAIAASYVDEPYQLQEYNAWGYPGSGTAADPYVIGGAKPYVTSTRLKRLGLQGTLQFKPTRTLTATVDAFYSNFKDDQIKRGIELPLAWGNASLQPGSGKVENGFLVSGIATGVEGVIRNDAFERHANLYSGGLNLNYEGEGGLNAFLDIGYSRTDRNELILESYSGTGFGAGNGARDTIGFQATERGIVFDPTLDYSNTGLIKLTDPQGWGGGVVPQVGYYNNRIVDDELWQFRGQVEKELETGFLSAVKAGVNYTAREKSLTPDEALLRLAGGALETPIPTQFLREPTNLSYLGLGPMVSYDPRELLAAGNIYTLVSNNLNGDVLAKAYVVNEDLLTGYVQADIRAELGSSTLTGNVGVQAIHTEQSSSGLVNNGGVLTPSELGAKFWDILPSLNLALRTDTDWVFRLALAREIQRPRLDQMRVAIAYGLNVNEKIITGTGGNPLLRPIRANAVDFNVEKYFGRSGYVALQVFYKDLKNFIYDPRETAFDFTGFPLSPADEALVTTRIGRLGTAVNLQGGHMYGAEAAGTLPFSVFADALDGFGITGGLAYTKTRIRETPTSDPEPIPGYSKWVANGTAFFERAGFSARGSVRHRTGFLGELSGFGGNRTRRQALRETIVDAQIGYEFQPGSRLEGLSVYLQGQNLTDERFATVFNPANPLTVIDYQIYGRRFLAGFNYKF
ncbi:MAG TPA: TonB-dependent receptor [Allosphingosinicella sp.]|jgi:iron complex outermembrane receptor protein|nr:TonB-dependent receptor [Allosphingosinicella sp.]